MQHILDSEDNALQQVGFGAGEQHWGLPVLIHSQSAVSGVGISFLLAELIFYSDSVLLPENFHFSY